MLLADKTVTITHLAYDGKTDTDVKTETVLHGCSWQAQHGSRIGTGTQTAALLVRCRIPAAALHGQELALAPGDTIACGAETAAVLAVHDNRRGRLPHIYVEGG